VQSVDFCPNRCIIDSSVNKTGTTMAAYEDYVDEEVRELNEQNQQDDAE